MLPVELMVKVLLRVMRRAAERLVAEKVRAKDRMQPSQMASDIVEQFRRVIQFEQYAASLQVQVHAHIEKLIGRLNQSPPLDARLDDTQDLLQKEHQRSDPEDQDDSLSAPRFNGIEPRYLAHWVETEADRD